MTNDVIAFHCCSSYFLTFISIAVRFVLIASPVILPPSPSYFLPVLSRGHFLKKFSALWSTFLTYGKRPSACRGRFYIGAKSDSSSVFAVIHLRRRSGTLFIPLISPLPTKTAVLGFVLPACLPHAGVRPSSRGRGRLLRQTGYYT